MDADQEADLRRRVHENLRRLASGEVAREVERERENRAARKAIEKKNARRIKQVTKRLEACREELHGLQEYMDQQLLDDNPLGYAEGMTEEQKNGWLEETDHAIEGCVQEINDLMNELELLRTYNVPSR